MWFNLDGNDKIHCDVNFLFKCEGNPPSKRCITSWKTMFLV